MDLLNYVTVFCDKMQLHFNAFGTQNNKNSSCILSITFFVHIVPHPKLKLFLPLSNEFVHKIKEHLLLCCLAIN